MKKNKKYIVGVGIILGLIAAFLILDSILFDGFKPRQINNFGFQANYYVNNTASNKAAMVLIGGGQWGNYWGKQLAQRGFVGLSLAYTGNKGLPTLPEEIPLEYFERAINWLREQTEVNPEKIVVMGASRNAELALIIASTFPELVSGVVAYAPSSVSWSNTVLPYNSDEIKPSWTYKGKDIPYVPMDKIQGSDSALLNTLVYWQKGLDKTESVNKAIIKVERIEGPILLLSGEDDKVWPSSQMADMLEKRIKEGKFKHRFENVKYENAGHLISSNPESSSDERFGEITINNQKYSFEFGGATEGDNKAKRDAKTRVLKLVENLGATTNLMERRMN
jgi:pimeloyl-ACP methyl ester carboxylesterase